MTGALPALPLRVRGLAAGYGERRILDGVDLDVSPGEVRVILGGSGCGKSTLLRACIGLLPPLAGEVRLFGEDLVHLEGAARTALLTRVGVMFQYGALLGSLTIAENVALPLHEHTILPEAVIAEIVRMKLAAVELSHAEHLLPSELSGGMRKRAAIARALALDPDLLFCDEPSAGLDPLTSAELDSLLLRLRDRFGMAVVVVTHELMSIAAIAERVVFLSQGVALADGPYEEVRQADEPEIRAFFHRQAAGEMRGPVSALQALEAGSWE